MRRRLVEAIASALIAVSCATDDTPAVRASLTTSSIRVDPPEIAGGKVMLRIENMSAISHSVVLLRTDVAYDKMALDMRDAADFPRSGMMARLEITQGATSELKLNMPPGRYVIMCAQPGHYEYGMRAPLAVR